MKRLSALASVMVLALGVGIQTASAQPTNTQVNQGNLISALNNINVQIDRLNALNNLTINDVQVVNVEDVLNNSNVLTNFLNNSVNNNTILSNLLNNNNCSVVAVCNVLNQSLNDNIVAISDLIAVNVLSGGDVILFYQPQA